MSLSREEVFECIKTGRKKAITMLAYKITKMQLANGEPLNILSGDVNKLILKMAEAEKGQSDAFKGRGRRGLYLMTVRPSDDVHIDTLINATLKFCERVYMTPDKYIVRFEQTGTTEGDWRGKHVHLLVNGEYRKSKKKCKSDYIRDLHKTYSKFMDIEKQYCDVKEYSKDKLPTLLNYLNGKKKDPKKHKAQEMDRIWRASVENEYIQGWGNLRLVQD